MSRRIAGFVVLAFALLAVPALSATKPAFKITTKGGKTGTFQYIGYEFSSGVNPKLGVAGKVEVDVNLTSSSQKALLKAGTLKAASLHVVATLPKKINKTYTLSDPKITSVEFVNGNSGPGAAIKLSYKKLSD